MMQLQNELSPPTMEETCLRKTGERLRFLRERVNLNLDRATALTGISRTELSRLETDSRKIKEKHLLPIASAYGLELQWLKDAIDFTPKMRLPEKVKETQQNISRLRIPFMSEKDFSTGHEWSKAPMMELTINAALSPKAYAICATISSGRLRPGHIIVADPNARTVISDLAVNSLTRNPWLIELGRDAAGFLIGTANDQETLFPKGTRVTQFDKVVLIIPAPYVFI